MVSAQNHVTTLVTTLVAIRVTILVTALVTTLVIGFTLQGWGLGFRVPKSRTTSCQFQPLQGYLAHKKRPPPLGPP